MLKKREAVAEAVPEEGSVKFPETEEPNYEENGSTPPVKAVANLLKNNSLETTKFRSY